MGGGWRRAFCTSVRGDPEAPTKEEDQQGSLAVKLGAAIFSSNPSTPRGLKVLVGPKTPPPPLQCKTTPPPPPTSIPLSINNIVANKGNSSSPRVFFQSSSSPSSSRFALLKTAFRLSKSRCGLCSGSLKSGGDDRTAIFTAECSHVFHFPCISNHVRTQACLVCPVCSVTWQQVPLLCDVAKASSLSSSSRVERHQGGGTAACKVYDDDESIQSSPTCDGSPSGTQTQFNPIPEEEDEDEDGKQLENKLQKEDINIRFDAMALLSTERGHQSYVAAIKIKAPFIPPKTSISTMGDIVPEPTCRAPVDLVTVLDASGSMTPPKLQMLKRAMRLVISSLGPGDRLSIVAFSAVAAKRLLPLRRMSRQGQRSARQIVDRLIGCGGIQKQSSSSSSSSSRVGDALRKATKVLEDRRERNPVATIMLLSDGHASQRQTHSSTRFAHVEIPIHVDDALAKCVNGSVSVVLRDVHLKFACPPGFISSVYAFSAGTDAVVHGEGRSVRLGDLYAGEERQLLAELRVPKAAIVSHDTASAFSMSVSCSYRDPLSRNRIECAERPLSLMPNTTQAEQQQLGNLFVTTRATAESRRLVGLNHLDTAIGLLSSARSLIIQQPGNGRVCNNDRKFVVCLETELTEVQRLQREQHQQQHSLSPSQRRRSEQAVLLAEARSGLGEEPLTPTSAWRAAEQLAKVAIMRKSLNRISDLHGLENARF